MKRKRPKKAVTVLPIAGAAATPIGATPVQIPSPAAKKVRTRMPVVPAGEPAIKRIKRAKGGVIKGPPSQGARIISRKSQRNGKKAYNQTLPTEIMRMVSALYTRETRIKKAEDLVALVKDQITTAERIVQGNPTPRNEEMVGLLKSDLDYAERRLSAVRAWRDFTSQKIRLFLDHALSTTPYRTKKCQDCATATPPCKTCGGLGTVRVQKTNHYALAAVERLKHLKKVLVVTELCAKVRAKTSESNDAYAKLLESNMGIVKKFGNENQTSMEHADAEQGAMIGILDAAMRFNPVKPECYRCSSCEATAQIPACPVCAGEGSLEDADCRACNGWGVKPKAGGMKCPKCNNPKMMVKTSTADFKTYAYNWAYRNSRARKETDKRAGVYAPSLDAMMEGSDDGESAQTVVADHGSKGSFFEGVPADNTNHLVMDLRHQVSQLTDEQQSVINYTLAGLSLTEIAQALGVSKATVSKIRDQAHAALKKKMTGYMESSDDDE